jgi:hypothetical protein
LILIPMVSGVYDGHEWMARDDKRGTILVRGGLHLSIYGVVYMSEVHGCPSRGASLVCILGVFVCPLNVPMALWEDRRARSLEM